MESTYLDALRMIQTHGQSKTDRTGVGTISYFGIDMRFDISQSFPLLTTKSCHFKSIAHELLWMLNGDTNVRYLQDNGVRIWNEWANAEGDLGPVYGKQWRTWQGQDGKIYDQISQVIETIRQDPHSRRLIVNAWNVAEIEKMALPPCHLLFQFYVCNNQLSCKLTQRSADFFLGVPFNIASYALLTYMIADQCNLHPPPLVWSGGDCHIYHNHMAQVNTQLTREPREFPTLTIAQRGQDLFHYEYSDFTLHNYNPHPKIPASVAV
jgi:thymidylate synthase